jgi:hypothetical protein
MYKIVNFLVVFGHGFIKTEDVFPDRGSPDKESLRRRGFCAYYYVIDIY